ncbi:hypothetical protein DD238_007911 [Peronospora effusa]|uniref:Uncharacterized protein n=1 Tax=Peronospora effusa TaxID=542832 RepID=A0A3M6V7U0_9STRA|nr:hypothetical protein DD238_007911 [Peronospora effusa]
MGAAFAEETGAWRRARRRGGCAGRGDGCVAPREKAVLEYYLSALSERRLRWRRRRTCGAAREGLARRSFIGTERAAAEVQTQKDATAAALAEETERGAAREAVLENHLSALSGRWLRSRRRRRVAPREKALLEYYLSALSERRLRWRRRRTCGPAREAVARRSSIGTERAAAEVQTQKDSAAAALAEETDVWRRARRRC